LGRRPRSLAYDAEVHGFAFRSFHDRVDGRGAALVLARSCGGAVFGGYNPEGWVSLGEDRASNGAFLFVWPDGDVTKPPLKLPKVRMQCGAVAGRRVPWRGAGCVSCSSW
jgi:hypothetical protein